MTLNQFWIFVSPHEDPTGGFSLFSKPHIIWLIVLAALIFVYSITYYICEERGRNNLRKGLALFLILYEISKQCVNSFLEVPSGMYLPVEICSMAEYTILIDALWPRTRALKQVMAFGFLPAAFMALMMPTVTYYPPISFYAIHQFVMHALIIAYIVARYAADEIRPKYSGIWISVLILNFIIIPIYYLNGIVGQNFMYLKHHDGNVVMEFIWNITGGNGGIIYVIGLEVLVILVMHIMYGIFYVSNKVLNRKM